MKEKANLDVEIDERSSQRIEVDNEREIVVDDAIGIDDVLFGDDLPGDPAQMKRGVEREHGTQMTPAQFATTAAVVLAAVLGDGLELALLTVRALELETAQLERHESVAHFDQMHQAVQVVG